MIIHSYIENKMQLINVEDNCSPRTSSRAQRGISEPKHPTTIQEIPRCTRDDVRAVTVEERL